MATVTAFDKSAIPTLLQNLPLTRPPDTQDGIIRLGSNLSPERGGVRTSANMGTTPARTTQRNSWAGGSAAFKALTPTELIPWDAQSVIEQIETRLIFMREWRIRHYYGYSWPFTFSDFWSGYCGHLKIYQAPTAGDSNWQFLSMNPTPLPPPAGPNYFSGVGNFTATANLRGTWAHANSNAWLSLYLYYQLNGGSWTSQHVHIAEGDYVWQTLSIPITSNPTSWVASISLEGQNMNCETWLDMFGIQDSAGDFITPNPHFNDKKIQKLKQLWIHLIGYEIYFDSVHRGFDIKYPTAEWQ